MMPMPWINSISAQGVYTDYTHNEVVDGEGLLATFNNKEWEGRLEIVHEPFGPITNGAIGFQYGKRDFEALGEAADYLLPTTTDSSRPIFSKRSVSPIHSPSRGPPASSGRMKPAKSRRWGPSIIDYTPASFAAGAVYRPMMGNTAFFANLSWTQRAPARDRAFRPGTA